MGRALTGILFGLLALSLGGCYVTRQAMHQNDLFNSRRKISDVLADPATPGKTRETLETVRRVLDYAQARGLNTQDAYRYYIQTQEPVVTYVVQAAQPDKLEFVTWWFPLVGDVPYLGYFKKAERDGKAAELKGAGFDVNETGAGGFSSLGWFEDPVFSSMLVRGEADLAHLFFHELTHRTLWIPGSSEFNENLAEYVAGVLTVEYLKDDGKTDAILRYEQKGRDKELFRGWLKALQGELEKLYAQAAALPRAELLRRKQEIFASFQKAPRKPVFKVADYVQGEDWNNASLLGANLYAPDIPRFERAHKCIGDPSVRAFLEALKRANGQEDDPFKALDQLCSKARKT